MDVEYARTGPYGPPEVDALTFPWCCGTRLPDEILKKQNGFREVENAHSFVDLKAQYER